MHEIDKTPYTDLEKLEDVDPSVKQSNASIVKVVMQKLTPLVEIIAKIDKLLNFSGHNLFDGFFYRYSPHTMKNYFMSMKRANQIQVEQAVWRALIHKDVWMPFGEETDDKGQLILNANFDNAVMNATSAATVIIAAIMQKQMQEQGEGEGEGEGEAMDMKNDDVSAGHFDPEMVKLDEASAQCIYVYDESRFPPFVKAEVGPRYKMSLLACATQVGMLPVQQLSMQITPTRILQLNPANVIYARFELTKPSPDHAKCVVLTIPTTPTTAPFSLVASLESGRSDPICLYVVPNAGMPSMKYQTNIVFSSLTCGVNCECQMIDPSNQLIRIDPERMTMDFLHTLDNVHITGDLQIPACPTERLIAARVSIPDALSEPVCQLLDDLNRFLPPPADPSVEYDKYGLFRLPFVYEINVQARTCTKTPMNYPEISKIETEAGLTYLSFEQYAALIQKHEELLIQNMLFQMMFIYEKRGENFRTSCPPHKMVFDFYIRRSSGQVVFHYDTTPLFQVSTLSLLFSMPIGMVRPGPYIAPLPVHTNPHGIMMPMDPAHGLPPGVCTFMVKRGTCIMANNHVVTHSTPGIEQLIERGVQDVPFMSLDPKILRKFNFPFMHVPDEFQRKMMESAKAPRSFLRMWHVNLKPETNPVYFGQPQLLCSQDVFSMTLTHCLELQEAWFATQTCSCIKITSANPTEMRSAVEGKVSALMGGRHMHSRSTKSLRVVMQPNAKAMQDKAKSRARASTMSSMREKIKSKLHHLKTIFANANRNVIIVLDALKRRSSRSTSRSISRTRRASTGQIAKKQQRSATRRRSL